MNDADPITTDTLKGITPTGADAPTLRMGAADTVTLQGQASPSSRSSQPGIPTPLIPGYEILGELGRGGMGVVYKARHVGLNRIVAIKMILSGAYAGADELKRFRMEAEAVAQLAHPGIVQVFEIGEFEGRPYFTLEYIDGGALTDRLKQGRLTPGDAAKIIEGLARTIHAAHLKKVIHRDLKPANVLLTQGGAAKITDFGLAKRLDTSDGMTVSGAVMGTPAYMAPEQARGRVRDIGTHTDVYALGAILYELMTGQPPFRCASTIELLQQVAEVAPQKPRSFSNKIEPALEAICLKCLEKSPADRYGSAELLAADLAAYLRGDKVMAEQHSNLRVLQMFTRDTRHTEVMVRFRKVNMMNSALIFIFSILTEVFLRNGMGQIQVLAGLWSIGAASMMLSVWWFRYRDPLPVVLIERQIVMVWGCFVTVAMLTGLVLQHQNQALISILPVLFLEAALAVGAMAIIIGGTFYYATVLTAMLGLVLGYFPALGIGPAGAILAMIVFMSVWKFDPAHAAETSDSQM